MNVLVTGNLGYIGSVLTRLLINKNYNVIGYDIDYYNNCELLDYRKPNKQILKDIRDISRNDLDGIDSIIHLSALSNDPLGELTPGVTEDINLFGTLKIADLAKEMGIGRFVYASSQSMYGMSSTNEELDEDNSEKNPITSYARTKWDAELALKRLNNEKFIVVCFRPSTVFGASPKLRCDIVYNNFVGSAFTTGKIEIKSDGTPWRPVVHVEDVCNAFISGLEAPEHIISGQSFNVGIPNGNFTVRDLAVAAQKVVVGSELEFKYEHVDSRTYKVSFSKILTVLKDYYKPKWSLIDGGTQLVEFFKQVNFTFDDFIGRKCNRLKQINYLIQNSVIDSDYRRK